VYVLGIDAGGSKTVALLADGDGRVVGEGRAGGANLQSHGELEVEKVLHAVMDQAIGDPARSPSAVCLGVAGVDRDADRRVITDIMRRLGFRSRTLIVNDALIALVAGAGDGPGIVIVSGTGSIAYGTSARGVAARAGGWGHVLADEGSGYWIGKRALEAVMRQSDGRGPRTRLTPLVLRHFGIARPEGLVKEIYEGGGQRRQSIAALGEAVEQARADGDAVAAMILSEGSAELVLAAMSVVKALSMVDDSFPVFLSGGMFRMSPWLAADVSSQLQSHVRGAIVSALTVEPAVGAVRLAQLEARGGAQIPRYVDRNG
jgi:N-acetylglucosamine kinase-like BadF-type ATPase